MTMGEQGVCVRILDKELRIACAADQEEALRESARYLDQQMRRIRQTGKVVGLERIALMAALNITNELLTTKKKPAEIEKHYSERLQLLQDKIDEVLANTNRQVTVKEE